MSFAESGAAVIAAGIDDMYDAFLAKDQARFDSHLHTDVTTWETHLPGPLRSRRELDEYREQRDAAGQRPSPTVMAATDKRIDVWEGFAVARYVLVTEESGSSVQRNRVTDVLRQIDGRWLIVHHHSELVQ